MWFCLSWKGHSYNINSSCFFDLFEQILNQHSLTNTTSTSNEGWFIKLEKIFNDRAVFKSILSRNQYVLIRHIFNILELILLKFGIPFFEWLFFSIKVEWIYRAWSGIQERSKAISDEIWHSILISLTNWCSKWPCEWICKGKWDVTFTLFDLVSNIYFFFLAQEYLQQICQTFDKLNVTCLDRFFHAISNFFEARIDVVFQ